jgi:hypothetical protein
MAKPRAFEDFIDYSGAAAGSACQEWIGHISNYGYGRRCTRVGGKKIWVQAHRIAYERAYGPIPMGLCVLHRCDNRACVRLEHLFLGTKADNMRDKVAKGRQARGEGCGAARLTAAQVLEIRSAYRCGSRDCGGRALGRKFGISQACISRIVRGLSWSSVEPKEAIQ